MMLRGKDGCDLGEIRHIFERVEKKYVVGEEKARELAARLGERMIPDEFGLHGVLNVYYDTEDYALIRGSVEKPVYKEKFRLRGYSTPGEETMVFAELKKKYRSVVYKRRVVADEDRIERLLQGEMIPGEDAQTQREILWFFLQYDLAPRAFVGYDREALVGREDPELRVTFDRNLRWRGDHLRLSDGARGEPILPEEAVVVEIKIAGAAPLWLARLLSDLGIYPTSFSKYGECYLRHIAPNLAGSFYSGGLKYAD